jgi:hypothetical protein
MGGVRGDSQPVTAKERIVTKVEPRFRWTSCYMGRQEFEVIDETGIYRVETRYVGLRL